MYLLEQFGSKNTKELIHIHRWKNFLIIFSVIKLCVKALHVNIISTLVWEYFIFENVKKKGKFKNNIKAKKANNNQLFCQFFKVIVGGWEMWKQYNKKQPIP